MNKETSPDGKNIEKIDHGDGRQSVIVHVNALSLDNPDAEDLEVKKIIEEQILPKLNDRVVLVTVVHKESLLKATVKTKFIKVRQVAEVLIAGFPQTTQEKKEPNTQDFIIIEVEGDDVCVTQL